MELARGVHVRKTRGVGTTVVSKRDGAVTIREPACKGAVGVEVVTDDGALPTQLEALDVAAFARLFLSPHEFAAWSKSGVARALLALARPYKCQLQWRAAEVTTFYELAYGGCDELVALLDASVLLEALDRDVALETTAYAVLRRMARTSVVCRDASPRRSAYAEHGIERVLRLPLKTERFAALYALGAWECGGEDVDASAHGLLYDAGRTLVLPFDADAAWVTMAAAELLDVRVVDDDEDERTLSFGVLLVEADVACAPRAPLRPYVLELEDDGVRLVPTHEEGVVVAESARSVDELVGDWERTVAYDTAVAAAAEAAAADARRKKTEAERRDAARRSAGADDMVVEDVRCKALPLPPPPPPLLLARGDVLYVDLPWILARFPRLHARAKTVHECVREVQMRRVVAEWSLEGLEHGRNASSLGLSVLLALALGYSCGLDVRVFAASTWAACVGVARRDGAWLLYDPTRTVCNGFDALAAPPRAPLHRPSPGVGDFVEVLARTVWHLAVVRSVNVKYKTIDVQVFALKRKRKTFSLHAHVWRPLSTPNSDVGEVLRRCLRAEKAGSSHDDELSMEPLVGGHV
jgi:hypothetical protein